jgi:hypothetical protein
MTWPKAGEALGSALVVSELAVEVASLSITLASLAV